MLEVRVILVEPEGSINVGLIARTLRNFNVKKLYLVRPKIDFSVALEFSAKGYEVLKGARIVDSLDDAIKDCNLVVATSSKASAVSDPLRYYTTPWELSERIKNHQGKVAIIFGRESTGLTRDEIGKAHVLVTIPASKDYPVLNVAQSVAIIMYEIFKNLGYSHLPVKKMASPEKIKLLKDYINITLSLMFKSKSKRNKIQKALERIIFKTPLSEGEVKALTMIFRKLSVMLKKSRQHKV